MKVIPRNALLNAAAEDDKTILLNSKEDRALVLIDNQLTSLMDKPAAEFSQIEGDMENENTRVQRGLDDLEGEIISGRYQIIKRIGKGGMGVVYLAQQTNLNRNVCIKVLNPALLDDADAVGRFEREAKGLSRLQHPNIVTIFDYGRDGNLAYIVMEYAQGETLGKYLKAHGALTFDEFLPLAVQTLKGIGEAHKLGLIHRDIKPANLVICELEGEKNFIKILDFGLAKLAQGGEDLTKEQQLVGSASYMAPELILNGTSDTRTDVYALGVMFYLMLSGKKPFVGSNDNAILYQHVNATPAPLKSQVEDSQNIPAALCEVIDQCLNKKPEKRPQTALDMLNAISIAISAPQLSAGYSSMSLSRVDAIREDQRPAPAETAPAAASISTAQSPAAPALEDKIEEAHESTHSHLYEAGEVSPVLRDRKFLVIGLIFISAVLAVVLTVIISRGPDSSSQGPVVEETKSENSNAVYDKIEDLLNNEKWDDAENLIAMMKDLPESKTEDHLLKTADFQSRIAVGKLLSEAQKEAEDEHYDKAIELYEKVLDKDPNHFDARTELDRLNDLYNTFPTIVFEIKDQEESRCTIDDIVIGTTPNTYKLKPGSHHIRISRPGFEEWSKSVTLNENETVTYTIELESKDNDDRPQEKAHSERSGSGKSTSGSSKSSSGNILGSNKKSSGSTKKKKSGLL